jgi:hypothetical protein
MPRKHSSYTRVGTMLAASLLLVPILFATHPPKAGGGGRRQSATTFGGRATVVDADVLGIRTIISDTSPVPSRGGALQSTLLTASALGLLTAKVPHAAVVAQGDFSHAESSVANLNLSAAGAQVTAGFLMSRASAQRNNGNAFVSGGSDVVDLNVNGTAIAVSGQPNQTILLGPVEVIINEQSASASGATGDIAVNALHLIVTDPVKPGRVVADIVISSSHANIACGSALGGGGDLVTCDGWITGTPTGAQGIFAVAGGRRSKSLWGYLTYIDQGSGLQIKGTGVTAYWDTNPTTCHIEGTCEVNGHGGLTYSVELADDGKTCRDTFAIRLSNGYSAAGTLGRGHAWRPPDSAPLPGPLLL